MKKVNHSHYYIIDKQEYKFAHTCAGLNCLNKPTSSLKIKYINKTGHFCKKCTRDLLELDLAEEVILDSSNDQRISKSNTTLPKNSQEV
ncbi:MAG: hypothetical protein ABJB76_02130 [Candidatus Nitrosocosmicus sp.]